MTRDQSSNAFQNVPERSAPDISPYEIPQRLWEKVEPYMEKQNVTMARARPQSPMKGSVVVYRTRMRRPGNDKGTSQTLGPTMDRLLERTDDGLIPEQMIQRHSVWYEFTVYAESANILESVAWDLEGALLFAGMSLSREIPGFAMVFDEQPMLLLDNLQRQQQDDILALPLVFRATLPIRYIRHWQELQQIRQVTLAGRRGQSTGRITRTDSSDKFVIPQDTDQVVVGVQAIFLFNTDGTNTHLIENTDYKLVYDADRVLYVQWNDQFGLTPSVGRDFRIDYLQAVQREAYVTKNT